MMLHSYTSDENITQIETVTSKYLSCFFNILVFEERNRINIGSKLPGICYLW